MRMRSIRCSSYMSRMIAATSCDLESPLLGLPLSSNASFMLPSPMLASSSWSRRTCLTVTVQLPAPQSKQQLASMGDVHMVTSLSRSKRLLYTAQARSLASSRRQLTHSFFVLQSGPSVQSDTTSHSV